MNFASVVWGDSQGARGVNEKARTRQLVDVRGDQGLAAILGKLGHLQTPLSICKAV
jgi:hypothetical protein